MIYDSISIDERERRQGDWHDWFAWHPVRISPTKKVWMERVERRGGWVRSYRYTHWQWEYRLPFVAPATMRSDRPDGYFPW